MDAAPAPDRTRLRALLFGGSFLVYASFHPGGGWNQNGRFAMVRAIVEEGRLAIDDFLLYRRGEGERLVRLPIRGGTVERDGRTSALGWREQAGRLVPIAPEAGDLPLLPLEELGPCTGDLAFGRGQFYPNKPPGASLLAVPGYALVRGVGSLLGADPDDVRVLAINAWLTSALSVGLLCALGSVLFFEVASRLFPGPPLPPLLSTLAFSLGTLFLPYATMLYDHGPSAVALLGAFAAILRQEGRRSARDLFLAGLLAGLAVLTNYLLALAALAFALYALRKVGWRGLGWFLLGALPPALLLLGYHAACFGSPFATAYAKETPEFRTPGAFLEVLREPRLDVLGALLFSPYRGLLVGSPFLLLGLPALWRWARGARRPEAALCAAIVATCLLFNMGYIGWDGGWGIGPRYLVPAIPFLGLPATSAFARVPRVSALLAGLSVASFLLSTAVDPQAPIGHSPMASVPGKPAWRHSPLLEYEIPLFAAGRAEGLLRVQEEWLLRENDARARADGIPRDREAAAIRSAVERGDPDPLPLAAIRGPVSAGVVGIYEGWLFRLFPVGSRQAEWNSFNVGEFLFPARRWSLLPLLLPAILLARAIRIARRTA